MSVDALRRARTSKVTFVVTSDAHETRELDRVHYAVKNAERAWIPPDRVANASGVERLVAWSKR
jgi:histidinol phosphatase-like PHP family hydrolase